MSQQEVHDLLQKEDKWLTTKEIAKKLNQETGSINANLRRMFDYKEVHKKFVKVNNNWEIAWRIK